jgi:hypothetical protein
MAAEGLHNLWLGVVNGRIGGIAEIAANLSGSDKTPGPWP